MVNDLTREEIRDLFRLIEDANAPAANDPPTPDLDIPPDGPETDTRF